MDRLRVTDVLQAVGKRINTLSSEVSEAAPPPPEGATHQPSSAAMRLGHAGVQAAAAAMATRLQDTGEFITAADALFNANEVHSAEKLSRIS
jgi:hypothetical protein